MENNTIILDSREKNKILVQHALDNNWQIKRLVLSHFIPLKDPKTAIVYPEMDCGDITNLNHDGIIELKSYSDFVNSTTGGGVTKKRKLNEITKKYYWTWNENKGQYHLREQVIKMYSTGIPFAVFIHGSRWQFQKISGVSDELITRAKRKIMSLQARYKFTIEYPENIHELIELVMTFLKVAFESPRKWPIYNLFKGVEDTPVAMLCGMPGFGPEISRAISRYKTLAEIGIDTQMGKEKFIKYYSNKKKLDIYGMGKKSAELLYNSFSRKTVLDDPNIIDNENKKGDE